MGLTFDAHRKGQNFRLALHSPGDLASDVNVASTTERVVVVVVVVVVAPCSVWVTVPDETSAVEAGGPLSGVTRVIFGLRGNEI